MVYLEKRGKIWDITKVNLLIFVKESLSKITCCKVIQNLLYYRIFFIFPVSKIYIDLLRSIHRILSDDLHVQ